MIVELVDKLADRLIQLWNYREEVDRHLFENFITPIHADFEILHQEYLDSFKGYRRMVKTSADPFNENHPVLDVLEEDATFNGKLRLRIHGMVAGENDPLLGKFITSIYDYFHRSDLECDDDGPPDNFARNEAQAGIREVFESDLSAAEKQSKAIRVIDQIIEELQGKYFAETREFFELKKALT